MANLLALVSYKVFPPQLGGQKTVVGLYDQLSRFHKLHLAVSEDNAIAEKDYDVTRVLHSHEKMIWNAAKIFKLKQICRDQGIQCLIAEHSYTGWIAYLLKKLTGIPFIIRSHNIESSRFRQMNRSYWRLYHHYEKWIHRKANHNFFISADDEQNASEQFGLSPANCSIVPYGVGNIKMIEDPKRRFREKFGLQSEHLFYFNGTLDYKPNADAVMNLIGKVNPMLQAKALDYTILVSGKGLSAELKRKINNAGNMAYLGYVEDVAMIYQAVTAFLNPVINNSGVKTKVIEALANNCAVVSMHHGANGIPEKLCGMKLVKVRNGDWDDFVEKTIEISRLQNLETPSAFFNYFSSENIAKNAADKINYLVHAMA